MSLLLEAEGLRYSQGGRLILDLTRIAVLEKETLVILGSTGAGKSTLLRMINFLLFPQAGSFRWRGQPVTRPVPLAIRRRIAMAFQEPLLFEGTVFDNVAYGLALRGTRGKTARAKVMEVLRLFRIDQLARQSSRRLSGGEAQRTALARALVIQPELLLLDEPLASLDPPTKEQLAGELKHLLGQLGLACVYVTHDQEEAFRMADRIAVLERGRLLQIGGPDEIFYRPRTPFVANFVRTENLLEGIVEDCAQGLTCFRVADRELEAVGEWSPGQGVLACLRPEEILLRKDGQGLASPGGIRTESTRNHLPGQITELRRQGPTTRVVLDCGFPLVALVTHRSAQDMTLQPGDKLVASFKATAIHLIPRLEDNTENA